MIYSIYFKSIAFRGINILNSVYKSDTFAVKTHCTN